MPALTIAASHRSNVIEASLELFAGVDVANGDHKKNDPDAEDDEIQHLMLHEKGGLDSPWSSGSLSGGYVPFKSYKIQYSLEADA